MRVLGIDPGYERSAWLLLDEHGIPKGYGIDDNDTLLGNLRKIQSLTEDPDPRDLHFVDAIVIEQIASYGMAVGAEVFETVFWSGRFAEAAWQRVPVHRMPRRLVKLHLCGDSRAKDANIRQALLDLYGGPTAKGTKRLPGPLHGVSKDVWSALAVARTFWDGQRAR